jgi:multidrug efflux pump subunit AcrB
MVTPWLMMKFGSGHGSGHGHAGQAHGGVFGKIYLLFARPILKSKARSWAFLLAVGIVTMGSLVLFYTKDVTVKLLPFDNKSELQVVVDLPEGSSVEATDRVLQQAALAAYEILEVHGIQTYAGTAAPFNFNGLVRHYYVRQSPELGDVQIMLSEKSERERTSHDVALELREKLKTLKLPEGTALKVVEPPPGPPVLATLLAEIYGPDAETRRAVAAQVHEAFAKVPFVADIDDSFGARTPRLRLAIDQDSLEYQKVEEADVYDTLKTLLSQNTIGYSYRGGGRQPIPIVLGLPKPERTITVRALSTPVPANALPGGRGIVELGDVVRVERELSSFPIFRHNGRPAEMVMAELAGAYEAPVYGMIEAGKALDTLDWSEVPRPQISLHGQPLDESAPTLLWDGEWEVTWVTFRDMGAAFMVALLGIYILVVAQFGSFKVPLVILTPIPLTFIGIMFGHWIFGAAFTATSMIGFIALAGIIVRNSILLVDFVKNSHKTGSDLRAVLLEAGAIRFKPILLTAIAAMIGAVVILADPIFQGLAISLLFGLASSTALTVLVIPAIYMALRYREPVKEQDVPETQST